MKFHDVPIFLVAFATIVVSGCAERTAPPASTDTSSVEQQRAALLAVTTALGKAIASRDGERIESFFSADGWLLPPNSPPLTTAAERRAYWDGFSGLPPSTDTVGETWRLEIADSGELASKMGSFIQVTTDRDGANLSTVKYNYVAVWRKQADGQWKVISNIWTTGR